MASSSQDYSLRMSNLHRIIMKYEITNYQSSELWALQGYDIVFLCDDSGSMQHRTKAGITRWDEMKETVRVVVDVAKCFDDDGVDVYFLNRAPAKSVFDSNQLNSCFARKPTGYTPLSDSLNQIVADLGQRGGKPVLLVIATDGQPTTKQGRLDHQGFRRTLESVVNYPHRSFRVQFLACSDQEEDVGWLNTLDREVKHVDVTDDYASERAEVLSAGRVRTFTRGDFVCKALLGGISDFYDKLDEGHHHLPLAPAPYGAAPVAGGMVPGMVHAAPYGVPGMPPAQHAAPGLAPPHMPYGAMPAAPGGMPPPMGYGAPHPY